MGWLQYLFPVVGAAGALLFMVVNPSPIFIAGGLLFAAGSVSMGVGMGLQQRLSFRNGVRARRGQYLTYLAGVREQVMHTVRSQRQADRWRHPDPEALAAVAGDASRVWERRPDDPDFLVLRAGTGRGELATALTFDDAHDPMTRYDPVSRLALGNLVAANRELDGLALTVDASATRVLSVVGPRQAALATARALTAQLAALHAPEEVRLALAVNPQTEPDWEWAKWLPHLRPGAAHGELADLPPLCGTGELVTLIASRAGAQNPGPGSGRPPDPAGQRLVVVVDGVGLPPDATLRLARGGDASLTILAIVPAPQQEPAGVGTRLTVEEHGGLIVEHPLKGAPARSGRADRLGEHGAEALARQLAPLWLGQESEGEALADDVPLTALLGIADAGRLDPARAWRPRPPRDLLRIPIGIDHDRQPVLLDMKESALGGHGPHGLIVGATGSGKSELLRTIVTGLAATHHPETLAFVLVDFKGGAAFARLSSLPHVAGMITNLANEGAMIDRTEQALSGELRRRQQLLRDAGDLDDLHEYHRRRDAGAPLAPLPYLVVIVDEFGELLSSRPDFIDVFEAIGRLGRSLGVHLVLSSQQLEEGRIRGLETHLSYRIALRTFSAQESRTVLGMPDAYELPPIPGSAYLKVGTTIFTRFRAAMSSRPYVPSIEPRTAVAPSPSRFGLGSAGPAPVAATALHGDGGTAGETVADVIVRQLRQAAPRVHQVWLPPLPPLLTLDQVPPVEAGNLVVPIGLRDLPAEQRQDALRLDLSGDAGHLLVVGSPLTGRSTLLRTLLLSLACTHTPLEAQFYVVDYGGGSLRGLERLPHCGGVAVRGQNELVQRTLAEVAGLVEEREQTFRRHGIDSALALRAMRAAGRLEGPEFADVFLLIDNWPAVRQESEERQEDLEQIATRGLGLGIHLVLSASRWMDVKSSLRDAVGGRVELRLHDPTDSMVDRRAAAALPPGTPGRGLTLDRLQFQTALPRLDGMAALDDLQAASEAAVRRVEAAWSGDRARRVRVLPRLVRLSELQSEEVAGAPGIPIGVSEVDLGTYRVDLTGGDQHLLVFGDGESGKTNLLEVLLHGLVGRHSDAEAQILLVDYRRTLLGAVEGPHLLAYAGSHPALTSQVSELATFLGDRLPGADLSVEQLRSRSWWRGPEVYVVVDDYDLVATPGNSPLAPLLPLLPQAQDVGLHLVVARRVGGASRGIYEPVLQRLRELGSWGILLSGDAGEGPLLAGHRAGNQPPGRGLAIRPRRRPVLVQTAIADQ